MNESSSYRSKPTLTSAQGYGITDGPNTGSMRFQGQQKTDSSSAVKVFDIGKRVEDVATLKQSLPRKRVYNMGLLEPVFPTHVFKSVVHDEIRVEDDEVNVDINLIDPKVVDGLDPENKPYVHLGCVAVAVIPHGRDAPGTLAMELIDTRYNSSHGVLAKFGCKMSNALSAFARFPGYFVSSYDIKDGYTIGLRVKGQGLELCGGVRPLSIQVICIFKVCGEEFKHRYALGKLPAKAYQNLLNAYLLSEDDQTEYKEKTRLEGVGTDNMQIEGMVRPKGNGHTLVMSEVYDTIKKLYPEHGGYIKEEQDSERDHHSAERRGEVR
nr:movement protein [Carrot vitivirus 1]